MYLMSENSYNTTTATEIELYKRLRALEDVAVTLLREKDPHVLLKLIVQKAMDILLCDGGSLYLKSDNDDLIFEVSLNNSSEIDFTKQKISGSAEALSMFCFNNVQSVNVKDVYKLPKDAPFKFNKSFDEKNDYRTKSILVCPLVSSKNEPLGVIQMVNRKKFKDQPWPEKDSSQLSKMPHFNDEDEHFLQSFASLASVAIENAGLYKNIQSLLEGFVKASITAIEARDQSTCGHSERVALLTVDLAEVVNKTNRGKSAKINFSDVQLEELRYASLLHDFGKISVKENVLLKSNKLHEEEFLVIQSRFKEFANKGEIEILRHYLRRLEKQKQPPSELSMMKIDQKIKGLRAKIEHYWMQVVNLNKANIVPKDVSKTINELKKVELQFSKYERPQKLLLPDEIKTLGISKGSLSEQEREQINQHVTDTYLFLKTIPWTKELENLPEIAYSHHEKLDGTGYPRKLKADEIPTQSKIMTVVDIFDALVAMDRPYKKAVPIERALDILQMDAKAGKIESEFLSLFIEAKLYESSDFLNLMGTTKKKAA